MLGRKKGQNLKKKEMDCSKDDVKSGNVDKCWTEENQGAAKMHEWHHRPNWCLRVGQGPPCEINPPCWQALQ